MTNPVQIICYLYQGVKVGNICFDVQRRFACLLSFKSKYKTEDEQVNITYLHNYEKKV